MSMLRDQCIRDRLEIHVLDICTRHTQSCMKNEDTYLACL